MSTGAYQPLDFMVKIVRGTHGHAHHGKRPNLDRRRGLNNCPDPRNNSRPPRPFSKLVHQPHPNHRTLARCRAVRTLVGAGGLRLPLSISVRLDRSHHRNSLTSPRLPGLVPQPRLSRTASRQQSPHRHQTPLYPTSALDSHQSRPANQHVLSGSPSNRSDRTFCTSPRANASASRSSVVSSRAPTHGINMTEEMNSA